MATDFSAAQWILAIIAAICIGMSKAGFNGVSLLSIALMAQIMPARQSTGVILPMLVFADCFAVQTFRQHAKWREIRRVLPSALLGVVAGAMLMAWIAAPGRFSDPVFKRLIGGIILCLALLQGLRQMHPEWFARRLPAGSLTYAWTMGGLSGVTTMLANAAGPIMSLYLLAVGLPKLEFVGTSAWIFLLLNLFKLPFSYHLGLIGASSLSFNLYLLAPVAAGVFAGKWLLNRVPQRWFTQILLGFALVASLRLLWG